jgi:hypothetical protein
MSSAVISPALLLRNADVGQHGGKVGVRQHSAHPLSSIFDSPSLRIHPQAERYDVPPPSEFFMADRLFLAA